jgi:hypothetical protein
VLVDSSTVLVSGRRHSSGTATVAANRHTTADAGPLGLNRLSPVIDRIYDSCGAKVKKASENVRLRHDTRSLHAKANMLFLLPCRSDLAALTINRNSNHRDRRPELPLGALCVPLLPDLRFSYVGLATAGRQLGDNPKGDCMAYSSRRVANTLSNFSFLQ